MFQLDDSKSLHQKCLFTHKMSKTAQLPVLLFSMAKHADGLATVPMPDAVPPLSCVGVGRTMERKIDEAELIQKRSYKQVEVIYDQRKFRRNHSE